MKNTLASNIDIAGQNAKYDAQCKIILSNKEVLAWILKSSAKEYKDCAVKEIAKKYIESEPQIGKIFVNTDETSKSIRGINTEDTTVNEGSITYDIRFLATVPNNENEVIELIVNVEAQNDYNPSYPLLKRGIYYCSRMISAQKGIEFTHSHYEKIKKVYSIWICSNPPKDHRNTITRYSFVEENVVGNVKADMKHYDLMNLVMICLGNPNEENYSGVLELLEVLLSSTKKSEEKMSILEKDFKIEMTEDLEKEVSVMCNLSKGVLERGLERGREEGMEKGIIMSIKNLIDSLGLSEEQAMDALKIPKDKRGRYKSVIEK